MCGNPELRQSRTSLFVLILAVALAASTVSAAVTGVVVDDNGAPVPRATVKAYAVETPREIANRILANRLEREPLASVESGDDGTFRIDVAQPVVQLVASAPGHLLGFADAAGNSDAGALIVSTAKPQPLRVTADGKPLAGAIVIARGLAARVGQDGAIDLPLREGTQFVVFHPDFAVLDRNAAGALFAEAKLTRGAVVKGRVMSSDGRTPVAHATVLTDAYATAETADDGTFTIRHASPQWQMLRAIGGGGAAFTSNNGSASYDLRIHPAASLSGNIRDPKTNAPVAGARVSIIPQQSGMTQYGARAIDSVISDAKGNFTFDAVPPGSASLMFSHPTMQLQSDTAFNYGTYAVRPFMGFGIPVDITAGQKHAVTVSASPFPLVRGRVIDEQRKPVAAAFITGFGFGDAPAVAVSNANGEFSVHARTDMGTVAQVSKNGYIPEPVPAPAAGGKEVVVTLRRGMPLVVRTVDREKKPVEEVSFVVLQEQAAGAEQSVRSVAVCAPNARCVTGKDGTVEIRIPPGTYTLNFGGRIIVPKTLAQQKITEKSSPLTVTVERGVELSGKVVYSDGSPAADARVVIRTSPTNTTAITDAGGSFEFTNAARGPVTLQVMSTDFDRPGPTKEVTAPATGVVITMPPAGRIAGTVTDSATHQPITDFQVGMKDAMRTKRPASFNSNDGSFVLEHISAGRVDLEATAGGYARGTLNGVEVVDGKTTSGVEIHLDPAAHVTGHVTSQDGSGLSGVYVTAIETGPRRGAGLDSTMSDANGEYTLTSVPAGDRRITFAKPGYVRQEKSVTAEVGKDARVDAMLERGLDLRGRVVDEGGQGVANANVRVQSAGEMSGARSDSEGGFTVAGLRDGHYSVVAQKNGYVEARLDDVTPSSNAAITLTMRRGGTVTGHVSGAVSSDFAPIMVRVGGMMGIVPSGRADSSGNFSISGVPDGHFTVTATVFQQGGSPRNSAPVSVEVTNGSAPPVEVVFKDGFTIQGRVTTNGRPVTGGNVGFAPMAAGSQSGNGAINPDGTYSVTGLVAGDYRVMVALPTSGSYGYSTSYSTKYTVSGSGVFDIDMATGSLTGHVTDAQSGAPIPDAQIIVAPKTGIQRQGTTDSQGAYALDPMMEGAWRLNVQKDGYQAVVRDITIAGPTNVDVQLSAGVKSTVHVVDALDGHPVAASVGVTDASTRRLVYHTTSGTDGVADLWAPPGTYTITAGAVQYTSEPLQVTLPASDIQLRMLRTGRVVVRWSRPGITRVDLEGPFAATAPGAGGIVTRRSSSSGVFENLRPGQWKASLVGADGKAVDQQPVTVASGETATVVFP